MKIYTFYSDSHFSLYERLKNSVEKNSPSLEIVTTKINQDCSTGEYMSTGWGESMKNKLSVILSAIDNGEIFIHADSDIVFLKESKNILLEELGDNDIAFQNDGGTGGVWYCMGFFICKPTKRIKDLFTHVISQIDSFEGNDQLALNNAISDYKNNSPGLGWNDIKYKHLSNRFFTYGLTRPHNNLPWTGQTFQVPQNIVAFHANWTKGIQNKHKLIDYISCTSGVVL
jgi:hypothetical protein